jgi:hypothetical protein
MDEERILFQVLHHPMDAKPHNNPQAAQHPNPHKQTHNPQAAQHPTRRTERGKAI